MFVETSDGSVADSLDVKTEELRVHASAVCQSFSLTSVCGASCFKNKHLFLLFCCLNTSAPAALTSDTSSSRLLLQVTDGYFCTDAGFRTRPRFCCWFLLQINVAAAALHLSPARFPRLLSPRSRSSSLQLDGGRRVAENFLLLCPSLSLELRGCLSLYFFFSSCFFLCTPTMYAVKKGFHDFLLFLNTEPFMLLNGWTIDAISNSRWKNIKSIHEATCFVWTRQRKWKILAPAVRNSKNHTGLYRAVTWKGRKNMFSIKTKKISCSQPHLALAND